MMSREEERIAVANKKSEKRTDAGKWGATAQDEESNLQREKEHMLALDSVREDLAAEGVLFRVCSSVAMVVFVSSLTLMSHFRASFSACLVTSARTRMPVCASCHSASITTISTPRRSYWRVAQGSSEEWQSSEERHGLLSIGCIKWNILLCLCVACACHHYRCHPMPLRTLRDVVARVQRCRGRGVWRGGTQCCHAVWPCSLVARQSVHRSRSVSAYANGRTHAIPLPVVDMQLHPLP